MVDFSPIIPVIVGGLISASAAAATSLVTNRGHDKRLKVQLFNNEQKNAIAKLHQFVMEPSKNVWDWWRNISHYLDTFEARAFLPVEEMAWARDLLKNIEYKMDQTYPDDAAIDEMEKQIDEQDKEEWLAALDEDERKDYEIKEYMAELTRNASSHLVNAVSSLANGGDMRVTWKGKAHPLHLPRRKISTKPKKPR